MKSKFLYIGLVLFVTVILLQSCEKTIVGELPYEEKLVVKCILTADTTVEDIFISKTLPPTFTEYSFGELPAEAVVNDAIGYISDGEKQYALENIGKSLYRAKDLIPKEGKHYTLFVSWKGHTGNSETYIPQKPEILSMELLDQKNDYFEHPVKIKIKGKSNTAYITRTHNDSFEYIYYMYGSATMLPANSTSDSTYLYVNQIWDYENNRFSKGEILSFPKAFFDFYNSKYIGGESPDGIFSTSGINARWNVKGEAIGLFLGKNEYSFNFSDYIKIEPNGK